MVVCLSKGYSRSRCKNVRKYEAACGRRITYYTLSDDEAIVQCVAKPNSRPSWYSRDVKVLSPPGVGVILSARGKSPHTASQTVGPVNCVDCLDSGYYCLRVINETDVE